MDHELDLILTLTGALTAALLLGLLTGRLRLSPIVGYLAAGIVVGPFTPGFVARSDIARQLAELGVILLMFGVGLNLHVKELLAVRKVAVPGAAIAMVVATALGFASARMFGHTATAGLVYGLALSVASTVVLLRVFSDNDVLHTAAGHVAVGWLLVEDLFTVLVVVLLPVLVQGSSGAGSSGLAISIALAAFKIAALVAFTILVGGRAIPKLLALIAKTRSKDLFTLGVLVIVLGVAVGSAKLFGASMALGAFLAGIVVGQSPFGSRAASEALPMRDAFAVLFFVSTGMLLDPAQIVANLGLTLTTLGVIIIGKPLAALIVIAVLKYPLKTALTVAVGLAQIGEFSFMIAALGVRLGVLPPSGEQSLVLASVVSITLNPILFRIAEPLARRMQRPSLSPESERHTLIDPAYRAIVVGYGPVGRCLAQLLIENGIEPTVIELNHETVARLQTAEKTERTNAPLRIRALYGDASQREILERAGILHSGSLIFSSSGSGDAVIRLARELNPDIMVIGRVGYLREIADLKRAGANQVVAAEGEVALAMVERLLRELGATSEQLDRARDRVRHEIAENRGIPQTEA